MPECNHSRADERERMVQDIIALAAHSHAPAVPVPLDAAVLGTMRRVPRHMFVPHDMQALAYRDRPLDIGDGQTISQPFIVALMTSLLRLEPTDRVLEVGTGCGYQTAILAELAGDVYSIEIVDRLARRAADVLRRMNYDNVHTRIGDGHKGWPEAALFDAIIVTAAAALVPQALITQLRAGGRMVIPVGEADQELQVITKASDGTISTTDVMPVRFVPFTRGKRPA